jgi:hypothetical protein
MTAHETRQALGTPAIPRPREPQDDTVDRQTPVPEAPVTPATEGPGSVVPPPRGGEYPWPEPWHFSRAARPRSEYWDVATASWHSRGVVLPPQS